MFHTKQITTSKLAGFLFLFLFTVGQFNVQAQNPNANFKYTLSFEDPASNTYQVEMKIKNVDADTLQLKMPKWMPGYYQIMDYGKDLISIGAFSSDGQELPVTQQNDNTWTVPVNSSQTVKVNYTLKAERPFVAVSKVDEEHAYIAPCNTYLYVDGFLNNPVELSIQLPKGWKDIATGLEPVQGTKNEFTAKNFDILYDCPILIGNLEELPPFEVQGVPHRFIGYKMGDFDKEAFRTKLKKAVEASVELMDDIPYQHYTFIGIGPGMGGIEHLNNTTISFNGNNLRSPESINRTLAFITHEYFHHYNVKRIRPVELGPFDYDRENRTTQLWVSEGLTVYYEYMIMKRAGLLNADELLQAFSGVITASENDPGKAYQSLEQSSYRTWDEGPFGVRGGRDTAITYYEKGPVVGLLLDFAIREASDNQQSLDDVMRFLYNKYYKELGRGFTDAEVKQACESFAGKKLDEVFEYITTTEPLDYEKYLGYAGLKLNINKDKELRAKYELLKTEELSARQQSILSNWLME
ncbi:M61 family metallopeptidase [Maribellus mangrovi]|uniref:M61 family metallopeptidase n=1 Tax=Maribellus mangrovi TaxID=3133146 RepID=UPI0030EDEDFB